LQLGRESNRPDILFLSYHIGHDLDKIRARAKGFGCQVPATGALYDEIHTAARQVVLEHGPKQDIVYTVYGLLVTVLFPWHLFMLATQPSWEFAARTAILTVGWSFAGPSTPAGTRFV
jgi:hypothetical protein